MENEEKKFYTTVRASIKKNYCPQAFFEWTCIFIVLVLIDTFFHMEFFEYSLFLNKWL
jgi:hypothetical protein